MKKIFSTILLFSALLSTSFAIPADKKAKKTTYQVNAERSKLVWNAKKVAGEHTGLTTIKTGTLLLEDGKLKGGSFDINVKDLTVTDIQDAEYNAKLVTHLKSDDFFSVEKHPIAHLEIISAIPSASNKYEVKGKLTIKGISHEVHFPTEIVTTGKELTAHAKVVIDRTKYNIRYNSKTYFASIGDKAIDDTFNLEVNLVATEEGNKSSARKTK